MKLHFIRSLLLAILIGLGHGTTGCTVSNAVKHSASDKPSNPYIHASDTNYLKDFSALANDGDVFVVVEIPSGSNAKWEVTKPDGKLQWEFKNGKPRVVSYLGYPGNYGMIPATLLPESAGGDGDPLDVIVLGPAIERGSVVKAKLIGVLKLLDRGEQDDKLIAVLPDTPFYTVDSIDELNQHFSGVAKIIELWFTNYKGPGVMQTAGYANAEEARTILQIAIDAAAEH